VTQVFLTGNNSQQTWPDPGNWNPTNTVEAVSAGGGGANGSTINGNSGGGGGGGAYAVGSNMVLTFPVSYYGYALGSAPSSNNATNFGVSGSVYTNSGNCISALVAMYGTGTGYGTGGSQFYPGGHAGANGGAGSLTYSPGAGGGGAGGPHGAGSVGASSTANTTVFVGGAADGGTVPGPSGAGATGISGTEWDASHGCGSGGNSNSASAASGQGGSYGGGGGGGYMSASGWFGKGAPSLIILTYVPLLPAIAVNVALVA
jgi:hypothetical protein